MKQPENTAEKSPDTEIIDCWVSNAKPWIKAVREQTIESRRLITDKAILNVIEKLAPSSILDLGCGEGWLMRALAKEGRRIAGLDCVPELLAAAKRQFKFTPDGNMSTFYNIPYEVIDESTITERFQLIVCNFSLIGKESVEHVFSNAPHLLLENGWLVIQTLHPNSSPSNQSDGWREGSWDGIGENFNEAAPWYFRTLESWQELFINNGFDLLPVEEPENPKTGLPASLIMVGQI